MRFFRSNLVRNTLALYGVQVCRKVLPFVSIPYLARVLGPSAWGRVAFVQAFSEMLVLLIEFGFTLSATREIARQRHSREACSGIVAGVLGAQALLAIAALIAALTAYHLVPELQEDRRLVPAGIVYALAQGFAPLWFFQGIEKMTVAATLEIAGKALALIGIFAFIHSPTDDWKVLALQACAPAISTVLGLAIAYRIVRLRLPSPALVRAAFQAGWPMFVFRSGISLYSVANAFTLGLFASPAQVGYYASSEKIAKAAYGLLNPIREALYPRLSHLAKHSEGEMVRLARAGAALMSSGGVLLGIGLFVFAPWIVHTLMGAKFEPAIPVLRILSLLPPIISITDAVGVQWLLPHGHDKAAIRIILSGGLLNLVLAFTVAPQFAQTGMAVVVVVSELFVCIAMVIVVWQLSTASQTGKRSLRQLLFSAK